MYATVGIIRRRIGTIYFLMSEDNVRLSEGFFADIAVFDPRTIIDRSTFEQLHVLLEGVRCVLVNGTFVVRDGRHTGATPGRPLRGPGGGRRTKEPKRGRRCSKQSSE